MENFIMREISEISKDYPEIRVSRTRTSKGFCQITISFKNQKFILTNEDNNDSYELQALELAKILDIIASNPCSLPMEAK